jgi:DNA invertase Pin-like site-specific DNA recombinase
MQLKASQRAGCKKLFTDRRTRATTARPSLTRCLKILKDGDTLAVWKLDRLARSLRDLIATLDDLRDRGVRFHSPRREHRYPNIHRPRYVADDWLAGRA